MLSVRCLLDCQEEMSRGSLVYMTRVWGRDLAWGDTL